MCEIGLNKLVTYDLIALYNLHHILWRCFRVAIGPINLINIAVILLRLIRKKTLSMKASIIHLSSNITFLGI